LRAPRVRTLGDSFAAEPRRGAPCRLNGIAPRRNKADCRGSIEMLSSISATRAFFALSAGSTLAAALLVLMG